MHRLLFKTLCFVVVVGIAAAGTVAEAQTASRARISGRVVDSTGGAVGGAEITFDSEVLQGMRRARTDANGNFASPPLPPGDYSLTFEHPTLPTTTRRVHLAVGRTHHLDVVMGRTAPDGGEAPRRERIADGSEGAESISRELLETLAEDRDLSTAATLAGGVHTTGPNDGLTIHGAQSWEGLFLADGVVLNENIRGQPFSDLLIEDALAETTVLTTGLSAEYGRFTGGVVTAVTRSGGNAFSGSLRARLDNDDWQEETQFSTPPEDEIDETFEATLGGRLVRDRLWFFLAARDSSLDSTEITQRFASPFREGTDEERLEAKLTGSPAPGHQLQLVYLDVDEHQSNRAHGGLNFFAITLDDGTLQDRELPQEALTADYSGVLGPRFFVEARYSEREFTFEGSGGQDSSIPGGTPVWDLVESVIYNESLFCGTCRPEERDNETSRLQASYFLSAGAAGSHDLTFGYETFEDIRRADNHQSANDWMVWNFSGSVFDDRNRRVFPIFVPAQQGGFTLLEWLPIETPSLGTDFTTDSAFVQDRWRLGDRWSLSLGLRWDELDYTDSEGTPALESDRLSPRLGLSFQPSLASPWELHASVGTYAGLVPNTIGNAGSAGGVPAQYEFLYQGPPINDGSGPLVDTETAVAQLFGWLFDQCPRAQVEADPLSCPLLIGADIPRGPLVVDDLRATAADEIVAGFSRRLGSSGSVRLDLIHREWKDFYANRTDLTTGRGEDRTGTTFDVERIINEDDLLTREYDAVSVLFDHRWWRGRLRLGGNYTWSEAEGNFDGETGGSGPVASSLLSYPEYREARWNAPEGRLAIDQEHRLRLWAIFDLVRSRRHHLNVSLLESFSSGRPYSAVGRIDSRPFVDNPGYASPPTGVDYFFSDRGAFETDDITRTDLAFNYSFHFPAGFEIFLQPEVLNVFDEDGVVDVDREILTAQSGAGRAVGLVPFDPFTETPVEGVHWLKGSQFGEPVAEDDFQTPRTYRISVGFRF